MVDSPLQAYHEVVMDSNSSEDGSMQIIPSTQLTINAVTVHAQMWFVANREVMNSFYLLVSNFRKLVLPYVSS